MANKQHLDNQSEHEHDNSGMQIQIFNKLDNGDISPEEAIAALLKSFETTIADRIVDTAASYDAAEEELQILLNQYDPKNKANNTMLKLKQQDKIKNCERIKKPTAPQSKP